MFYKAEDTELKREVAIKFLPRQIAATEEQRKRVIIEARAAAALKVRQIRPRGNPGFADGSIPENSCKNAGSANITPGVTLEPGTSDGDMAETTRQ